MSLLIFGIVQWTRAAWCRWHWTFNTCDWSTKCKRAYLKKVHWTLKYFSVLWLKVTVNFITNFENLAIKMKLVITSPAINVCVLKFWLNSEPYWHWPWHRPWPWPWPRRPSPWPWPWRPSPWPWPWGLWPWLQVVKFPSRGIVGNFIPAPAVFPVAFPQKISHAGLYTRLLPSVHWHCWLGQASCCL